MNKFLGSQEKNANVPTQRVTVDVSVPQMLEDVVDVVREFPSQIWKHVFEMVRLSPHEQFCDQICAQNVDIHCPQVVTLVTLHV